LKKVVLIKSTGVPASFHTVTNLTVNKAGAGGLPSSTNVVVASYYSEEAYSAGANSLASTTIQVPGIPAGEDMWEFADAALAKAAPIGADTSAEIAHFAAQNPYVFAGATIA